MPKVTKTGPGRSITTYLGDYDPVAHLNAAFAGSLSLHSLHQVLTDIQSYQNGLNELIASRATARAALDEINSARIQLAHSELTELFKHVESVRNQATETESEISEMMADIKQLDTTKHNLIHSMTVLKRLQMLTTAYEQLISLSRMRQYRDCVQLLQAVMMLTNHFKPFRSIDQVAALSRNVADLQRELLENICADFELAFSRGEVEARRTQLTDGCLVIDSLGEQSKSRVVDWYCNTQLREYRQIFRANQESGSLENISQRYSWFNRLLRTYDNEHATIFPLSWKVDEILAKKFSESTRDDYKAVLLRNSDRTEGPGLDVGLLLSCLQETLKFEQNLSQRFAARRSRNSIDTEFHAEEGHKHQEGAISSAFEPYMGVWVESQDRQLASLMTGYRRKPMVNADEEVTSQSVIASSTEMFHFYRLALSQCTRLSSSARLPELCAIFAKYLDIYHQQVLSQYLHERSGSQGGSTQELLMILNTADYCYETTQQLSEMIKSRMDENQRQLVDLQNQADSFYGTAQTVLQIFARQVDQSCDLHWREMRQIVWRNVNTVGDQSSFMSGLAEQLKKSALAVLTQFSKVQYASLFCATLTRQVIHTFAMNINACKPISEMGAEQLLLDLYGLRRSLLDLPKSISELSQLGRDNVISQMKDKLSRLDAVLKTIQVRSLPQEGLIQAYFIHIRDRSESNFRKILELKGITKRQDQVSLVGLFSAQAAAPSYACLPVSPEPFLASFPTVGSLTGSLPPAPIIHTGLLSIKDGIQNGANESFKTSATTHPSAPHSITSPLTQFLQSSPTMNPTLSAVLTAARESVDRFSSSPNIPPFNQLAPSSEGVDRTGNPQAGAGVDGKVSGGSMPPPTSPHLRPSAVENSRIDVLSPARVASPQSGPIYGQTPSLDLKAFGDRLKSTFRIGKPQGE